MSVVGPTRGGLPVRWRHRTTGAELVCVVVKPGEAGVMVLPVEPGGMPHPLDWMGSEASFLREYEVSE